MLSPSSIAPAGIAQRWLSDRWISNNRFWSSMISPRAPTNRMVSVSPTLERTLPR
jgi:hypothetical protein